MLTECVSAICTLGTLVLAILIMTRAISLEDALKTVGKALLLIIAVYFAVCLLLPPLRAGTNALAALLGIVVRWLVVTVFVGALVMLVVWVMKKFSVRASARATHDGGDE